MPKIYPVNSFPEDYQIVLSDLWYFDSDDELPNAFVSIVEQASVFREQMEDQLAYWKQEDFEKAKIYRQSYLVGKKLPPLITNPNDWLLDGFHRFYALTQLRVQCIECLELPPPR